MDFLALGIVKLELDIALNEAPRHAALRPRPRAQLMLCVGLLAEAVRVLVPRLRLAVGRVLLRGVVLRPPEEDEVVLRLLGGVVEVGLRPALSLVIGMLQRVPDIELAAGVVVLVVLGAPPRGDRVCGFGRGGEWVFAVVPERNCYSSAALETRENLRRDARR